MKKIVTTVAAFFMLVALPTAQADELAEAEKRIRDSLAVLLPSLKPDTIAETPMDDLYELTFGARIVYVSGDGRYLFTGKLLDLETRQPITDAREQKLKKALLDSLDEQQMIDNGDADAPHTITVFTDIDCGYCRKLHSEMADYNANGIRIRYLAYPRAGLVSESARDAESVWCAPDRHEAMDVAKRGGKVPARTCDNPVAAHYRLGQEFGISGTPALVLEDGEILPGYVPAARLRAALDQRDASAAN